MLEQSGEFAGSSITQYVHACIQTYSTMWSLDTDGGEDEDRGLSRALAEVSEVEMGRRQSEREENQEHRFKPG